MKKTQISILVALISALTLSPGASAVDRRSTTLLSSLPMVAQGGISAALGEDMAEYHACAVGVGEYSASVQHELSADFTSGGVLLRRQNASLGMTLRGYGYGDALHAVQPVAPQASSNRVEYRRGAVTEWYVNGPIGLEQGFTIKKAPSRPNGQPLTLALELSGNLKAVSDVHTNSLTWTGGNGRVVVRYTGLSAYDAEGKNLRARLEVRGERVLLRVDDVHARYPVVVDPWVRLAELSPSDGQPMDQFGYAVAIDGNTVVVGAPLAQFRKTEINGAAYVFVKPASGWRNISQTAKLTPSNHAYKFGSAVAVSGNTVVVGAPETSLGTQDQGAAYVFVKPAKGWSNMTETADLNGSDLGQGHGFTYFGETVAISGNTVVVGTGADFGMYVFVKPRSGWVNTTETAKLSADSESVSVSGNTVLGSFNGCCVQGMPYPGEASVFVKPAGGWVSTSTPDAVLSGSDETANDFFGQSVSISGNTVVVGAPYATNNIGKAYVFVKPKSGWATTTETAKLTAADGGFFGQSVAISANTAVIGSPFSRTGQHGTAYVFIRPKSGWKTTSKFNAKLTGTRGYYLGQSVSINGNTAVAGFAGGSNHNGGADVFGSK
jgi:hypothetical protein